MGDFGSGPYAYNGTSGAIAADSAEPTVRNVSSRRIDGKTRAILVDTNGNPQSMDDTAQRVLVLVSQAARLDAVVGADFEMSTQARIRTALAPLLAQPRPYIRLTDVLVSRDRETAYVEVHYFNLATNKSQRMRFAR
jgi:hypothetical protein